MKALVLKNTVVQLSEAPFPVHPDLAWLDCSAEVKPGWAYQDGQFVNTHIDPESLLSAKEKAQRELAGTDAGMIRVIEDILDALKAKNVLTDADIPAAVMTKINKRKQLREVK